MKKDTLKCALLLITGLTTATLIYPFVHELGHILVSVMVGAEVHQLMLFPVPSVLCNVGTLSNIDKIVIGFGGMVFPILVALVIPMRWFITWLVRYLLLGMSVLAFIISIISVIFGINPQDDMIQVLNFWNHSNLLLIAILSVFCVAAIMMIVKERPRKRICRYFEI